MAVFVYITCASREEADRIGGALLDQRLAACVNIPEGAVTSRYLWRGEREEAREILLLAKTADDRFAELCRVVRALHSYETPCIVGLPILMGDADYLAWIQECTRPLTFA